MTAAEQVISSLYSNKHFTNFCRKRVKRNHEDLISETVSILLKKERENGYVSNAIANNAFDATAFLVAKYIASGKAFNGDKHVFGFESWSTLQGEEYDVEKERRLNMMEDAVANLDEVDRYFLSQVLNHGSVKKTVIGMNLPSANTALKHFRDIKSDIILYFNEVQNN